MHVCKQERKKKFFFSNQHFLVLMERKTKKFQFLQLLNFIVWNFSFSYLSLKDFQKSLPPRKLS